MNHPIIKTLGVLIAFLPGSILLNAQTLPEQAPRTWVLSGQHDAFKEFCLSGAGAEHFARIKTDFDELWLDFPFPEEPQKYGDPDPRKRTSEKADKWRAAQDTCGQISTVAGTGALLWRVTGEDKYLEKSRDFILKAAAWDNEGATDVFYNDEAHFRLWRILPMAYDQIREQLSDDDRTTIIASFALRGKRSAVWIKNPARRHSRKIHSKLNHPVIRCALWR